MALIILEVFLPHQDVKQSYGDGGRPMTRMALIASSSSDLSIKQTYAYFGFIRSPPKIFLNSSRFRNPLEKVEAKTSIGL
jgi:hypothetical protein